MPFYEYECEKCYYIFEMEQKITSKPLQKCPKCNSSVNRLISKTSFILAGGGWYSEGYSKRGKER